MKLIEILYDAGFEWPEGDWNYVAQDGNGEVFPFRDAPRLKNTVWITRSLSGSNYAGLFALAPDWSTAVITREQYEAYCKEQFKAYRGVPSTVPTQPTATNTHTVYHDGEVYRKSTILLQTSQLVVWRCDGQEYAVKARQAMIDPDDDQVAAALMTGITGHDIAPEHITELRAQMGWGDPVDG